ncbi:MAG: VanZ family protein [Chitinophagales bacterium]|nr:VanZ family protein [Chitinophagales bacterium]
MQNPSPALRNFLKYNLPSILWAVFILGVCLIPGKELPSVSIWEFDKLVHFGVYVVLAILLFWGWKKQTAFPFLHRQVLVKIMLSTFSYGFAVEILQEFLTVDRHFELLDAVANAAGGIAGSLISVKLFR